MQNRIFMNNQRPLPNNRKMRFLSPLLLFVVLLLAAYFLPAAGQEGYVQRDGRLLRDSMGRMLQLRGLNYVNKDKAAGYIVQGSEKAFADMKRWGYNAVRLGVNWSALEPSPGRYDSVYLHNLDERVLHAQQQGLYVILDMHQDLFGEKFGNGAPLWATLDEGKPHYTGGTWSDAYFISPAVQTAFDNFWKNTPAPDGTGVQDHYISTWTMLAGRYRHFMHIVGFDLMNEPFIGSGVEEALQTMISEVTGYLNRTTNGKAYTTEEVSAMWMDEKGKSFILKTLTGREVFERVLQGMEPVYRRFEEQSLQPFYTKLAVAIRRVNEHHILFWEPSVSSNNGIPSHITPVAAAGRQQGYMPHLYDIVLDTDQAGEADAGRLSFMFAGLSQMRQKLELPLLIGEWGAFYSGGKQVVNAAKLMTAQIDSLLAGDFYWDYFDGLEHQAYFSEALLRPYMQAAAGTLVKQQVKKNGISLVWQENGQTKVPNLVYVPSALKPAVKENIPFRFIPLGGKTGGLLEIKPLGRPATRTATITWK